MPLAALAFSLVWATACGTQPNTGVANSSVSTTITTNANQSGALATANANQSVPAKVELEKSPAGSLATPTEAYKTAYTARQNKDLAGLKRVMSERLIGFLTDMGQTEKKSLDEQLKELFEQPQATTSESRNEKITGDKATLEYLDEKGAWKTMDFIKEGDSWKMTLPSAGPPTVGDAGKKHK